MQQRHQTAQAMQGSMQSAQPLGVHTARSMAGGQGMDMGFSMAQQQFEGLPSPACSLPTLGEGFPVSAVWQKPSVSAVW